MQIRFFSYMYSLKNNLNQYIKLAVNKLCYSIHAVKRMLSFGLVTYFEKKGISFKYVYCTDDSCKQLQQIC